MISYSCGLMGMVKKIVSVTQNVRPSNYNSSITGSSDSNVYSSAPLNANLSINKASSSNSGNISNVSLGSSLFNVAKNVVSTAQNYVADKQSSNVQNLGSVSNIGSSKNSSDLSSLKNQSMRTDDKSVFKSDGKLYIGNAQVYLKSEKGKYYIVDSKGNYVLNSNGNKRVINPSNLSNSLANKLDNYATIQGPEFTNKTQVETKPVKTTTVKKAEVVVTTTKPSTKGLITDTKTVFKDDGRMYVGENQVFVKEKDGKYYLIDSNGNNVRNSNGAIRYIDSKNISNDTKDKIDNYINYGSTYGDTHIYKNPNNGLYSTNVKDKDGKIVGDTKLVGEYTLGESYTNKDGVKVTKVTYKNPLGGYDTTVIKNSDLAAFKNQASVVKRFESEGYDLSSISKNIQQITDTKIILTNGVEIGLDKKDSEIYQAVLSNGLTMNKDYKGDVVSLFDSRVVVPGNKDINQLRSEFGLYGDKYIDNKFGYYDKNLTNKQTVFLNTLDAYCNQVGLTDQQKKDWAYIIGRESGYNTSAYNGSCYGIGQLKDFNITTYASDPNKYYSGDPVVQIDATYNYIMDRYGSIENARNYWANHGWY